MSIRGGKEEEERYKRQSKHHVKEGAEILIKDRNWDLGQNFIGYYSRTRTKP